MSTNNIHRSLQQDIENADTLLATILTERDALASNDAEKLQAVAKTKQELAAHLEANSRARDELLQQDNIATGASGIESYISQLDETEHSMVDDSWKKLQQLLEKCREQNRMNGRLIDTSQRRIQQAIALLHGQPQDEELYGRGGKPVSANSGHSLTRA